MPVPAAVSSPEALVRHWFGLTQAQLARYLGVTVAALAHAEAGRRFLAFRATTRLLFLAAALPAQLPAPGPVPALTGVLPPLPGTPPERVRRRHRDLRLLAVSLGQRLDRDQARAAALDARRQGLARLSALSPPPPPEAAAWAAWLRGVAEDLAFADPTPAETAVATHLLAARLAGVHAELAALATQ